MRAIHLRTNSSSNLIIGNTISAAPETVTRNSAKGSTSAPPSATGAPTPPASRTQSNYNIIAGNAIADTTSESIDIKEGTVGGVVKGNRFDGTGMTAASAWMNVKGNAWTIDSNQGQNSPENGYQTHNILQQWGDYNLFTNNSGSVDGSGYGVARRPAMHNTVACSNTLTGARRGVSNIECTNP